MNQNSLLYEMAKAICSTFHVNADAERLIGNSIDLNVEVKRNCLSGNIIYLYTTMKLYKYAILNSVYLLRNNLLLTKSYLSARNDSSCIGSVWKIQRKFNAKQEEKGDGQTEERRLEESEMDATRQKEIKLLAQQTQKV